MRLLAVLALAALPGVAAAFDANGVALGAGEREVKKAFPSARCQALEWKSKAAERRCDDAKISFGGVEARITLYLKGDAVQAFDVRFATRDVERVSSFLKKQYGAPLAESRDKLERKDKNPLQTYKVRWEKGRDQAVLISQLEKSRTSLLVSRGDFEEEIYRVR
jgi:hypothetical protein